MDHGLHNNSSPNSIHRDETIIAKLAYLFPPIGGTASKLILLRELIARRILNNDAPITIIKTMIRMAVDSSRPKYY